MKKQISFTTDLFVTERTDVTAGPQLGHDLAEWLAGAAAGGDFLFDEPHQAEWGWAIDAHSDGEDFVIGCGIMNESVGDVQADWLVTVERVRRWKFLGAKDSPRRSELCDLVQNVLRGRAHIREIRWTEDAGHFAPPKSA